MPQKALQNFAIRSCLCPISQWCWGELGNLAMLPRSVAKLSNVTKIESFDYDIRDVT